MDVTAKTVVEATGGGRVSVSLTTTERRHVFELVMRENGPPLTKLAFCLCRNKQLAEDLCAEAFARAWPRWESGKIEDLTPYVRQMVVNLCRKSWRRELVVRRYQPQLAASTVTDPSTPRDFELIDAVLRLSPHLRAAVVLRYFEDLSEAETATLLSISTGTVKSRVSRALTILRTSYEGDSHV